MDSTYLHVADNLLSDYKFDKFDLFDVCTHVHEVQVHVPVYSMWPMEKQGGDILRVRQEEHEV